MSIYRTAQGKSIDMNALILRNGSTRAVGNMGINAKGDMVDGNNRSIKKRKERVQRQYNEQVQTNTAHRGNVRQEEVQTQAAPKQPERKKSTVVKKPRDTKQEADAATVAPVTEAPAATARPVPAARTGLGAAIARARQVRGDGNDTTANANDRGGITKI